MERLISLVHALDLCGFGGWGDRLDLCMLGERRLEKQTSPTDQTCCVRLENQTCVWFDSGETDLTNRPDLLCEVGKPDLCVV